MYAHLPMPREFASVVANTLSNSGQRERMRELESAIGKFDPDVRPLAAQQVSSLLAEIDAKRGPEPSVPWTVKAHDQEFEPSRVAMRGRSADSIAAQIALQSGAVGDAKAFAEHEVGSRPALLQMDSSAERWPAITLSAGSRRRGEGSSVFRLRPCIVGQEHARLATDRSLR